jgi:hypothetical protein
VLHVSESSAASGTTAERSAALVTLYPSDRWFDYREQPPSRHARPDAAARRQGADVANAATFACDVTAASPAPTVSVASLQCASLLPDAMHQGPHGANGACGQRRCNRRGRGFYLGRPS